MTDTQPKVKRTRSRKAETTAPVDDQKAKNLAAVVVVKRQPRVNPVHTFGEDLKEKKYGGDKFKIASKARQLMRTAKPERKQAVLSLLDEHGHGAIKGMFDE